MFIILSGNETGQEQKHHRGHLVQKSGYFKTGFLSFLFLSSPSLPFWNESKVLLWRNMSVIWNSPQFHSSEPLTNISLKTHQDRDSTVEISYWEDPSPSPPTRWNLQDSELSTLNRSQQTSPSTTSTLSPSGMPKLSPFHCPHLTSPPNTCCMGLAMEGSLLGCWDKAWAHNPPVALCSVLWDQETQGDLTQANHLSFTATHPLIHPFLYLSLHPLTHAHVWLSQGS